LGERDTPIIEFKGVRVLEVEWREKSCDLCWSAGQEGELQFGEVAMVEGKWGFM